MSILRSALIVILALVVSATCLSAPCPDATGVFTTSNGTLLPGHVTEAWCGENGAPLQPGVPGNTQNAESWDGIVLGAQWRVWGMTIDAAGAVIIDEDIDEFGNGTRTYRTDYDGGEFWLSKDHSWSDGFADLTGTLNQYYVIATVTIVGGTAVGVVSNVYFTGVFANCPPRNGCVLDFVIANAMQTGVVTPPAAVPADYPPFLCGADSGELFDACCITAVLDCLINNEEKTWGAMKALYR